MRHVGCGVAVCVLIGSAALAAGPAVGSEGPEVDAIAIEREPNDEPPLADGPIERGERYGGYIDSAGDVDWLEIPGEEADGQLLRAAAACPVRVETFPAPTDTDPDPAPIAVDAVPGEIAALRLGSQADPIDPQPVLLRISATGNSRGCEWRIALGEDVAMRAPTPPPAPPRVRVIRRTATTYTLRVEARFDPVVHGRRPVVIDVLAGRQFRVVRGAAQDASGRVVRTVTVPRTGSAEAAVVVAVQSTRDFTRSGSSVAFRAPTERPLVPMGTFAELSGLRARPVAIYLGQSFCSPRFTALRWRTFGERRATASGTVHVPRSLSRSDSCAEAAARSLRVRGRVVVSRPIACRGRMVFSRIDWTYAGRRSSYTASC